MKEIYELKNDHREQIYGCVPNGEIGISVIVSGESHMQTATGWEQQPVVSVYGLVKKVQFHKMSPFYREINLGFTPHYLQLLLRDSLDSLSKTGATNLADLISQSNSNQLLETISNCLQDDQIAACAEAFLVRNTKHIFIDERVLVAHHLITKGEVSHVVRLSDYLNLSSTSLRNLFRDQVGISPKALIKIHRIKRALQKSDRTEESLTQLACDLGYHDQSHFIHDFKDAIGITPKQYFSNKQLTFDFYNFQRWSYDSFAALNK